MTPNQTYNAIEIIINKAFESLDKKSVARQNAVAKELRRLLNSEKYSLDLDSSGMIRKTSANLVKVDKIIQLLQNQFSTDAYRKSVQGVANAFSDIEGANNEYYNALLGNFRSKPVYRDVTQTAIDRTLQTLNPDGFRAALEDPIRDVLKRAVQRGGNLLEMSQQLFSRIQDITDDEGNTVRRGYLRNYHWRNRITKDALYVYNRAYNQTVAFDTGLVWYLYQGPIVKESRDFCRDRVGNYYHEEEIRDWADLTWQGKARGTNRDTIFELVGGYECNHDLRPTVTRRVPDEDLERARRAGLIE